MANAKIVKLVAPIALANLNAHNALLTTTYLTVAIALLAWHHNTILNSNSPVNRVFLLVPHAQAHHNVSFVYLFNIL